MDVACRVVDELLHPRPGGGLRSLAAQVRGARRHLVSAGFDGVRCVGFEPASELGGIDEQADAPLHPAAEARQRACERVTVLFEQAPDVGGRAKDRAEPHRQEIAAAHRRLEHPLVRRRQSSEPRQILGLLPQIQRQGRRIDVADQRGESGVLHDRHRHACLDPRKVGGFDQTLDDAVQVGARVAPRIRVDRPSGWHHPDPPARS